MKNHRFLWLRSRTTDNRKCEKARNIKGKRTIEMFNTVSNLLVVHHSSANDSFHNFKEITKTLANPVFTRVFLMFAFWEKLLKSGRFLTVAHKFS